MPIPQFGGNAPVNNGAPMGSTPMNGAPMNGAPMNGAPMGGMQMNAVPGMANNMMGNTITSNPNRQVPGEKKKYSVGSIIMTISLIVVSLLSITFIGLFVWKNSQYVEAQTDLDEKIAIAVADAKDEQAEKDEKEFAEREKYPYRSFMGPADYGQLSFEYPKTWSLYVASPAITGGDYKAFLNPIEVEAEGKNTINALRVEILDKAFDDVAKTYEKKIEKGELTLEVISVAGVTANKYTGTLPDSELYGSIVTFKTRDTNVVLSPHSVLFESDYNRALSTITFNA